MSEESAQKMFENTEAITNAPISGHRRPVVSAFKRLGDILISVLVLFLFSPIFLYIVHRIRRDSPGPVLFKGDRMGRFGKPFKILKFRTMYEDDHSYTGAPVTAKDDDRITPFGKYLRETKLNELPQLWNVLKGEMSLVGPRPEDYDIALTWPDEVKTEIFSVRPGITSPASVIYRDEERLLQGSGFMDDYLKTILPDKLRLDQLYIRNSSIFTDLDVLAMTAVTLLPALRRATLDQRWLFGGPFYLFFRRIFSWFMIDMFVTAFAVGISGIVWRLSAVINLGWQNYLLMSIAIAVFVSLINLLLGLNRIHWRSASPIYVVDLAFSVGITMTVLYGVTRLWFTDPWLPFSLIWLIGITMLVGLVFVRYRDRMFTGLANRWLILRGPKSSFAERILIVGAGNLAEMTIWLLQRSAYSSIFGIIGMVDDDARKRNMESYGVRVLGTTADIPALVKKFQIGLIFFAIANGSENDRTRIDQLCEATNAKIVVIPDLVKVLERSIKKITTQESS
jgi:lipopolysaccharide/colanic/teichoic acid biosynthesis glycosyltransferase